MKMDINALASVCDYSEFPVLKKGGERKEDCEESAFLICLSFFVFLLSVLLTYSLTLSLPPLPPLPCVLTSFV